MSSSITTPASTISPSSTPAVVSAPGAPTIGAASAGNAQANISFSAPASNGGAAITSYTVTSNPGSITSTGSASPINIAGLTNGIAYTFTVIATNSAGAGLASAASNSVTPTSGLTVAGPPTAATATAGNTQASVSFSAPASNGGAAITSYTVTSSPGSLTASGAASPLTVTGLTNGTAYTFTVTATNSVGVSFASAASNSVTPATTPGAPTAAAATAGNAQASVSFSAPASNGGAVITSYTVTSSPGNVTASGAVSPLTVTGLTNRTAYTFTVTATNSVGTSSASVASNSATPDYVVTTIAGSAGVAGSVDGTGSAALFNHPAGVAVDVTGNLFIADSGNFLIRKITSAGVVTTFAGSGVYANTDGTGIAAGFIDPRGITIDGAGNLYIAESWGNHVIRKITAAGVVTTFAGTSGVQGALNGVGTAATFNAPYGVAIDNTGTLLYVADANNCLIRKIDIATKAVTTFAGSVGIWGNVDATGTAAQFSGPSGVAVDSMGNIYVSDAGNHAVRKITSAGVVTTLAGGALGSGNADGYGALASFNGPFGITVDSSGNVYVADSYYATMSTSNNTIRKITPTGLVTTIAGTGVVGSADGNGRAATFNSPYGVTVDSTGKIFITDYLNHLIRKIQ